MSAPTSWSRNPPFLDLYEYHPDTRKLTTQQALSSTAIVTSFTYGMDYVSDFAEDFLTTDHDMGVMSQNALRRHVVDGRFALPTRPMQIHQGPARSQR